MTPGRTHSLEAVTKDLRASVDASREDVRGAGVEQSRECAEWVAEVVAGLSA
ncbi:MAG: hypothetical protein AAGA47_03265 [Pseudomonadota bacterium]